MKADLYFKDTPEGRAFYPWGVLAGGRIVTPQTETALKHFINAWLTVNLLLMVGIVIWLDSLGPLYVFSGLGVVLVLTTSAYVATITWLCAGCARTAVRMTRAEFTRAQGQSYSSGYMAFLIIVAALFVLAGLYIVVTTLNHPGGGTAVGALCALFFGYSLTRFIAMARARRDKG